MATVVACGGESDEPPSSPAATPTPAVTATATPTAPPETTATASPPATPTPAATPAPRATPAPTPTPTPTPSDPNATTFQYDTYDTTGAVSTAGSYAFLSNPDDTSTAVTTYEALRDGTATALLIHTSDADGASRADVYDEVEVGDLFEWRQADDCFVRYTVTEVKPDPAGDVPRKALDVAWMTFTYTGCSGTLSTSNDVQIVWGDLPNLGGESLKVPVIHGAYEIVPIDWEGETLREYVSFPDYSDPVETDDITVARTLDFWREPTIPEGWTFDKAISAGGDAYGGARWGYCATWGAHDRIIPEANNYAHPQMGVRICADFTSSRYGNRDASWSDGSGTHETRVIAGRPAILRFSPPGPNHSPGFPTLIEVFDPETEVTYEIEAIDYDLKSNPEAVVAMARSLFEDVAQAPGATTFRYDTYDTTGAVSTPGSYVFLSDPDDTSTAVTTYEGLRDGTTTALLIHTSDADGVSRADVYDTVEEGDLFEWHQAGDCFVRYTVTEVKPDPAGTVPRKLLAVEWMTYAYSGCSGTISANANVGMTWSDLLDLGGVDLPAPVVHGRFHLVPENWEGTIEDATYHDPPDESPAFEERVATTLEAARALNLPYWREPTLPEGWTLSRAWEGGLDAPRYGFVAIYLTEPLEFPDGRMLRQTGLKVLGAFADTRRGTQQSSYADGRNVRETRVIAGLPAMILRSPPGPNYLWNADVHVRVYDPDNGSSYTFIVSAPHRSDLAADGNAKLETAIAIVRTFFESPEEE